MDELPLEVSAHESPTRDRVVSLGSPRRPVFAIVAALVVVAVLAVLIGSRRSSGRDALPTTTSALTSAPVTRAATSPAASGFGTTSDAPSTSTVADRTVTELGAPMLASRTQTELIIHTLGMLVRIDLDRGRITRTVIPAMGSGAPTFMVAGSRSVLLRPLDNVTGYLVADDAGAEPLSGRLGNGTLWAYPGPKAGLVWVGGDPSASIGPDTNALALVGFDIDSAETSVPIANLWPWGPDGAGQVVVAGVGGAYVAGLNGLTRVTTGDVFAAGPTKWLVRECDETHVCTLATIDRRTDNKAGLDIGPLADAPGSVTGVITQDGRNAAIVRRTGELEVIDLTSGELRNIATSPSNVAPVAPVWSLDSRFLFFASDTYTIAVFDRTSGTITELRTDVDHVRALAVRPAP